MSEIPEDIRAAAKKAYFDHCDDAKRISQWPTEEELIQVAARAILAERQRCAEVAASIAAGSRKEAKASGVDKDYTEANHWNAHADGCDEVASAILQGPADNPTPPEEGNG